MRFVSRMLFIGIALISLTACSEEASKKVADIKDQVVSSVTEIKDMLGENVETLDLVNQKLVQVSKDVILLLEELKFDIGFKENGITFENQKGISGIIGINGDTVVLDLQANSNDADTIQTIIRIANIFSSNNTAEDKINAFIGQDKQQEIQLNNGYLKTNGKVINLHLENYLF